MSKIYNFFKFIETKTGKKLPSNKGFKIKLAYAPQDLTKDDLVVNGDLNFGKSDRISSLPDNLTVNGNLRIQQDSPITTLPENLTVSKELSLSHNPNFKELPRGLHTHELNIIGTDIDTIPEDLKVEKLSVSDIPLHYPKHLEDSLAIKGGVTVRQIREWKALPEVSITTGRKVKKGRGFQIPLSDFGKDRKWESFAHEWRNETTIREIEKAVQSLSKLFDITFDTVTIIITLDYSFDLSWILSGKDNKGRELLLVDNDALVSAEGQISTKSFNHSWNITDERKNELLHKLFPKSQEGEKPVKGVPIRTLMTGPDRKNIVWHIGRKTRGGYGVEGKAKDLIPSLSTVSQQNMNYYAKKYGVTWGDMAVFENNDAINVIARSNEKTVDGYYYFDKYGYGQGGGSRVFEGPDYTKP